jgi:single-stranded-DNA-specific exonuclease
LLAPAEWVPAAAPEGASRLESEGLPRELALLLARRGVTDGAGARRFLAPAAEHLHPAGEMTDLEAAAGRLLGGGSGERVAIVGDYDVDGVASAAMLAAVLRALGRAVEVILPDRQREGYGFQAVHAERAARNGCRLIVTVDCGSSSAPAVERAQALGLDVIVTDHHIPGGELPPGTLHVNPCQPRCAYPFPHLAAAGITFKLCGELLARSGREPQLDSLLRLACLGTIADVVPLLGENRTIAALGLKALEATRSHGLRALIERSGMKPPFTAEDVGFRLGPRLNAAGRLQDPASALELLLSRDARRAAELATQLDELNRQRQAMESRVVAEARQIVLARGALPGILIAWSAEWPKGVVGLAAGRLAAELHRPTVLLAIEGGTATGSGRSVEGLDLHRFLIPWAERMVRFGGHAQALGLSVEAARLDALRGEWEEASAELPESLRRRVHEYELELGAAQVGSGALRSIAVLAPFGQGNWRPLVRVGPLRLRSAPRLFGRGHLAAEAAGEAGPPVGLLGWGWAERAALLQGRFEVLGAVEVDGFTGRDTVRLLDARAL